MRGDSCEDEVEVVAVTLSTSALNDSIPVPDVQWPMACVGARHRRPGRPSCRGGGTRFRRASAAGSAPDDLIGVGSAHGVVGELNLC
jgi:hypothetical protein